MSDETNETTDTSIVVADNERYYPALRWGRGQFAFPRDKIVAAAKAALPVTLEEFVSFMGTSTSPSRSPEKWKRFLTVSNVGFIKVEEGVYPYAIFDVEGHEQMQNFVHFVPSEPASKLLPALHAVVSEDPESYGLKVNSGKSAESRAKYQFKLDSLLWKPELCTSNKNKTGEVRPTMPNPLANNFVSIPSAHHLAWCVAADKKAPASKKASKRGREDEDEDDAVPEGLTWKKAPMQGVSTLFAVPVGSDYSTKVVDGVLHVSVYGEE